MWRRFGEYTTIIEGLKEAGYLIIYQNNKYVWRRRKELLDHWLNGYATLLRPKLLKGKYACKKAWQDIQLNTQGSAWGGEYAANLLTNYLRPENRILRLLNYELIAHKESKIARDWASKKGWEIQYALKILAALQKGMISNADYYPLLSRRIQCLSVEEYRDLYPSVLIAAFVGAIGGNWVFQTMKLICDALAVDTTAF